jgi:hypothetical protein
MPLHVEEVAHLLHLLDVCGPLRLVGLGCVGKRYPRLPGVLEPLNLTCYVVFHCL